MDLDEITEETLAAFTKAQTTGVLESTGLWSYDLTGLVQLIPVFTPFRDTVKRVASTDGSPFAIWRAFMNLNNSQPNPSPGFDFPGNEVIFQEQDFQAPYQPISLAGLVTQDAYDLARGLYDPYANTTMQVLNQVLIGEEKKLIGAQSYALAQPGTITATPSTTGGAMTASTTYKVAVAARTGAGYYYGGNSQARASGAITTTGTTGSIASSIAAVRGAVAYDWFQSPDSGTTWYYYGTTTAASILMTATLAANNAVSSGNAVPNLSTTLPTINTGADNGSANAKEFNGFLSSLTGDYNAAGQFITPGTGTANPSAWIDGGGAALTLSGGSVSQIETVFGQIWNNVFCSPTSIMMNSVQAQEIANLILGGSSATTFLNTDASGRINVVAGGRVGEIVNAPAGGVTVPIVVQASLPPGTIVFRTDRVPFPQSDISSVLEVRTLRDMSQFDYATNRVASAGGGPRKEFEIRSIETFINRAPVAMGVLTNIS